LVEDTKEDKGTTEVIEFAATAPSCYKLKVQRFCKGTVGEWIAVRKANKELWQQNIIISQADLIAISVPFQEGGTYGIRRNN
jgi:hypothetical protein